MALHFPVVLSASLTASGAPVYLAAGQRWTRDVAEAQVFTEADSLDRELTWARGQEATVCDPYAFSVDAHASSPTPISARERIRAKGPSVGLARAS